MVEERGGAFAPAGADAEHEAIRLAMDAYTGRVDYPLHVVTTVAEQGAPSGCVVGFVTQCSISPPRFLVCLSKVNHTYFVAERSDVMAVHLLGDDQRDLALLFAETTGDTVDKFSHCRWRQGETGAPVLAECAAWWEGVVLDRWAVGDHQTLLVRPVAGGIGGHRGLLTLKGAPGLEPGHPATA